MFPKPDMVQILFFAIKGIVYLSFCYLLLLGESMHTTSLVLVLLSILTAAACVSNTHKSAGPSPSVDQALPNPLDDTCGAANYGNLLGKPDSIVNDIHFSQPMRLIRPNQPVTMDLKQERINFDSNDKHIITRIHCA